MSEMNADFASPTDSATAGWRPHAPELDELAEQLGAFMEFWGFKKIHGQIWCHLFLSRSPLDAGQLMARLNISKALVSISLRELIDFHVVQECERSERATKTYSAKADLTEPILEVIRRRERMMVARLSSAYHLLANLSEEEKLRIGLDPRKLTLLGTVIKLAEKSLDALVNRSWNPISELISLQQKLFGKRV